MSGQSQDEIHRQAQVLFNAFMDVLRENAEREAAPSINAAIMALGTALGGAIATVPEAYRDNAMEECLERIRRSTKEQYAIGRARLAQ